MPLTRSRDYGGGQALTDEERKAQDKHRRKFAALLEDAADEKEAVLITVLKDVGEKSFNGNDPVQGYLIRFIVLTGEHAGYVENDYACFKAGFRSRISKAGVGATFVARLGRYGTRDAIGLEDDQDGDVELAEAALKTHGDPFEDAAPGGLAAEVDAAKKSVKEKAAAAKAAAGDDDPPF